MSTDDLRPGIVERALVLAAEGHDLVSIKKQLRVEGYDQIHQHLGGPATTAKLKSVRGQAGEQPGATMTPSAVMAANAASRTAQANAANAATKQATTPAAASPRSRQRPKMKLI